MEGEKLTPLWGVMDLLYDLNVDAYNSRLREPLASAKGPQAVFIPSHQEGGGLIPTKIFFAAVGIERELEKHFGGCI